MTLLSKRLDVIELADVVALASNPIQGVLALLRWLKQFCPNGSIDYAASVSAVQDIISNNRSLLRKLSHYALSVSLMERALLTAELPLWLVPLLELPEVGVRIASFKRGSNAISLGLGGENEYKQRKQHCLETHAAENNAVIALNNQQKSGEDEPDDIPWNFESNNLNSSFLSYSESSVWKVQQNFYEKRGAGVWERGEVPSQISSNTFVANQYVNIILNFVEKNLSKSMKQPHEGRKETFDSCRDASSNRMSAGTEDQNDNSIDRSDCATKVRVAVVEIGAGHGLLSVFMARKFQEILRPVSASSSSVLQNKRVLINQIMPQLPVNTDIEVTVIATDFHSGVFEELMHLPWIRY